MGHSDVSLTLNSYGEVPEYRQTEVFQEIRKRTSERSGKSRNTGRKLDIDLLNVFLGLHYWPEIPMILRYYDLISADREAAIYKY